MKTQKQVIEQFTNIHGNTYDYSEVVYTKHNNKVIIICSDHGRFEQTPASHKNGSGCPECGRKKCNKNSLTNQDEIIKRFIETHGFKYDYSKVKYEGYKKNVIIICKKHGEFKQTPGNHIHNKGCKQCYLEKSSYEKYKNRKTILYYIKVNNLWKIGICLFDKRYKDISSNIIKGRYRRNNKDNINIKIIKTKIYDDGWEAYLKEQEILLKYDEYRYMYENTDMNWFGGYTELFGINILEIKKGK